MERVQEKLDVLLRQGAAEADVEVYHWDLRRHGHRVHLAVQVDRPGGVTLDDCARASRAIGSLLDREDPVPGSFVLEVSSPGVQRGLFEPHHYAQAVGRLLLIKLRGQQARRGRLTRVSSGIVVLDFDGSEVEVPLPEIASARLVYEQVRA